MAEPVVRKRATRKVARKTTTRKAPTRETAVDVSPERSYFPLIVIGVLILIIGGSVAIGFSDDGQINISDTINNKKIHGTEEEKAALQNIPVQPSRPALPDGGLVPTTQKNPNPPKPIETDTASTTASSTDATASSTDEVITEEEGDAAVPPEETPSEETPAPETPTEAVVE